jgi:hypothetical protein
MRTTAVQVLEIMRKTPNSSYTQIREKYYNKHGVRPSYRYIKEAADAYTEEMNLTESGEFSPPTTNIVSNELLVGIATANTLAEIIGGYDRAIRVMDTLSTVDDIDLLRKQLRFLSAASGLETSEI